MGYNPDSDTFTEEDGTQRPATSAEKNTYELSIAFDSIYQYPSPPSIPVDATVSGTPAEDAKVKEKEAEVAATDDRYRLAEANRMNSKYHGSDPDLDKGSFAEMRAMLKTGEMEPIDFYLKTGRIYAGERKSEHDIERERRSGNPGVADFNTPGLDEWHRMNPASERDFTSPGPDKPMPWRGEQAGRVLSISTPVRAPLPKESIPVKAGAPALPTTQKKKQDAAWL